MYELVMSLRVEVADEVAYTAVEFKIGFYRLAAVLAPFVYKHDPHARVQERLLSHAVEEYLIIEHRRFEYSVVGLEGDFEPVRLIGRRSLAFEGSCDVPALESFGIADALIYVVHL